MLDNTKTLKQEGENADNLGSMHCLYAAKAVPMNGAPSFECRQGCISKSAIFTFLSIFLYRRRLEGMTRTSCQEKGVMQPKMAATGTLRVDGDGRKGDKKKAAKDGC